LPYDNCDSSFHGVNTRNSFASWLPLRFGRGEPLRAYALAALAVAVAMAAMKVDRAIAGPGNAAATRRVVNLPASRQPSFRDSYGDGTPDFMRLSDPSDQAAFRRWFTTIAEFQAERPRADVPAEITDCASLLRFSSVFQV
jgi:hypothetical protein